MNAPSRKPSVKLVGGGGAVEVITGWAARQAPPIKTVPFLAEMAQHLR